MAKKLASRSAQWPLYQEFVFNHSDWVIDSADTVKKTLGSTVALSVDPLETGLTGPVANTITFDAVPMPIGAVIAGGEVIVETPYAGSTAATVSVGIAGTLTAFANAVDMKTAGRTALTMTTTIPMTCNTGTNIRLTIAYTVANATAGKVRVRVFYTTDGKANENTIN